VLINELYASHMIYQGIILRVSSYEDCQMHL